eukprot:gene5729-7126_t
MNITNKKTNELVHQVKLTNLQSSPPPPTPSTIPTTTSIPVSFSSKILTPLQPSSSTSSTTTPSFIPPQSSPIIQIPPPTNSNSLYINEAPPSPIKEPSFKLPKSTLIPLRRTIDTQLKDFLVKLDLFDTYSAILLQEDISSWEDFQQCTDENLRMIGFKVGHIIKVRNELRNLKKKHHKRNSSFESSEDSSSENEDTNTSRNKSKKSILSIHDDLISSKDEILSFIKNLFEENQLLQEEQQLKRMEKRKEKEKRKKEKERLRKEKRRARRERREKQLEELQKSSKSDSESEQEQEEEEEVEGKKEDEEKESEEEEENEENEENEEEEKVEHENDSHPPINDDGYEDDKPDIVMENDTDKDKMDTHSDNEQQEEDVENENIEKKPKRKSKKKRKVKRRNILTEKDKDEDEEIEEEEKESDGQEEVEEPETNEKEKESEDDKKQKKLSEESSLSNDEKEEVGDELSDLEDKHRIKNRKRLKRLGLDKKKRIQSKEDDEEFDQVEDEKINNNDDHQSNNDKTTTTTTYTTTDESQVSEKESNFKKSPTNQKLSEEAETRKLLKKLNQEKERLEDEEYRQTYAAGMRGNTSNITSTLNNNEPLKRPFSSMENTNSPPSNVDLEIVEDFINEKKDEWLELNLPRLKRLANPLWNLNQKKQNFYEKREAEFIKARQLKIAGFSGIINDFKKDSFRLIKHLFHDFWEKEWILNMLNQEEEPPIVEEMSESTTNSTSTKNKIVVIEDEDEDLSENEDWGDLDENKQSTASEGEVLSLDDLWDTTKKRKDPPPATSPTLSMSKKPKHHESTVRDEEKLETETTYLDFDKDDDEDIILPNKKTLDLSSEEDSDIEKHKTKKPSPPTTTTSTSPKIVSPTVVSPKLSSPKSSKSTKNKDKDTEMIEKDSEDEEIIDLPRMKNKHRDIEDIEMDINNNNSELSTSSLSESETEKDTKKTSKKSQPPSKKKPDHYFEQSISDYEDESIVSISSDSFELESESEAQSDEQVQSEVSEEEEEDDDEEYEYDIPPKPGAVKLKEVPQRKGVNIGGKVQITGPPLRKSYLGQSKRKTILIKNVEDVNIDTLRIRRKEEEESKRIHALREERKQSYGRDNYLIFAGKTQDEDILIHADLGVILKPHQLKGVQFLWDNIVIKQKGCILAHSMGLGKTIQVLSFLHTHHSYSKEKSKYLLIVPANTIYNWKNEFLKWLPKEEATEFKIYLPRAKFGENAKEISQWDENGGCMVLTYESFVNYVELKKAGSPYEIGIVNKLLKTDIVVIDEGHKIKTTSTKTSLAMNLINTKKRVILTGYPLQNNLKEYYTMIDFIRPLHLGTPKEFQERFIKPIETGVSANASQSEFNLMRERLAALQALIKDFVDRLGSDVLEKELPPKIEKIILVKSTPIQYSLLKIMLDEYGRHIIEATEKGSLICNHPDTLLEKKPISVKDINKKSVKELKKILLDNNLPTLDCIEKKDLVERILTLNETKFLTEDNVFSKYLESVHYKKGNLENSGKMVIFFKLLEKCVSLGDKVCTFCSSIATLNLLEYFLQKMGWKPGTDYFRLDGTTRPRDRQDLIERFNDPSLPVKLFLISTKAGSLGTNLTGGTRVIIMDLMWNPVHERQSVYRCFRIGQKKPVFVYTLITAGTPEHNLFTRLLYKLSLAKRAIDKETPKRSASNQNPVLTLNSTFEVNQDSENIKKVLDASQDPVLKEVISNNLSNIIDVEDFHSFFAEDEYGNLTEEEVNAAISKYQKEIAESTIPSSKSHQTSTMRRVLNFNSAPPLTKTTPLY